MVSIPQTDKRPPGLHPGATWRKTDLQVHTPRDAQWSGTSLPGVSENDRRLRVEWAKTLIREARKRGLDAIAITDHHDLAYVEAIQAAVREIEEEPQVEFWAFVGMEVTCDDSCQCLVLLDPDTPLDLAERLYGSGFLNIKKYPYEEPRGPQATLSGITLDKFVENLGKDAGLKDHQLVLPHAGKDKAHKTIFRQGFQARFANLPVEGFYIEHPFADLEAKNVRRLCGEDTQWGTRRRGVLSTGDNRSSDFSGVGKYPCWVRMGEPTVESLRQALLADEARIAFTEPSLPSQRILDMEVSSLLCGKSFKLLLNDGFTAIIGGRGTGKSAILEYLRFGIGRAVSDIGGEQEGEAPRLMELIRDTLPGGYVKVTLLREGIEEVWTRKYDDNFVIEVTRRDGASEKISIEEARERFQARGYHQKQLSTLRARSLNQADQITGIAAAELIAEQDATLQQINSAVEAMKISLRKLVQRWETDELIDRTGRRVKDLRGRREELQKALESKGVSAEAQAILKRAPEYAKAKQYFEEIKEALGALEESIESNKESLLDGFQESGMDQHQDFEAVRRAEELISTFKTEVSGHFDQILKNINEMNSKLEAIEKTYTFSADSFNESYKRAQEQQRENKELVATLVKLAAELEEAEKSYRVAEEQGKKLKNAELDFAKSRKDVESFLAARKGLLDKAATHANSKSEDRLRAAVLPYAPSQSQHAGLCSLLEGSHARDADENVRSFLRGSNADSWRAFCDSLIDLYHQKIKLTSRGVEEVSDSDTIPKVIRLFSFASVIKGMAERIWQRLTVEKIEATLGAIPDAHIGFQYKDQTGQFIDFDKASSGQQAAALLTLLLNQEAGTLIIDQPEEDLDNRIIMDVVRLLRSTKRNRQIIFATHNANIVVNGDADRVVIVGAIGSDTTEASSESKVAIALDGAIETPDVRKAITIIMEGGKEAFELRNRKYAFKEQ